MQCQEGNKKKRKKKEKNNKHYHAKLIMFNKKCLINVCKTFRPNFSLGSDWHMQQ